MRPIRVVVDARIPAVGWGGVQQVVIGLAAGHTSIAQSDLEILYLVYPDGPDWLRPYVASKEQFQTVRAPASPRRSRQLLSQQVPGLRSVYHAIMPPPPVPVSDGSLEALEPEIVHFPHQAAFLTAVRSIYQPHDLQHLHLPQFFTPRDRATRDLHYQAFCEQASLVAMGSTWGREDILRAYGLPPQKVAVVPLAPVVDRYPALRRTELEKVSAELRLPEHFCFYPAQTWPHKNHARLLEAVAQLRDRQQLIVPLVFSGAETDYRRHLDSLIKRLGLGPQVTWVGYVRPSQVRALYRLARCVVVPTLFESASQPVFEALSAGVAVACSNVTATPRQVGDAAIVFDPYVVDQIADAVQRLWTDPGLRVELVRRGKRRIADFTWERTAHHFSAYYRLLSGNNLTGRDQALLNAEPII